MNKVYYSPVLDEINVWAEKGFALSGDFDTDPMDYWELGEE